MVDGSSQMGMKMGKNKYFQMKNPPRVCIAARGGSYHFPSIVWVDGVSGVAKHS